METPLEIVSRSKLPIEEVSGLGRRLLRGKVTYLAVPDAESSLVTFEVDDGGNAWRLSTHDLSSLYGDGPSEWEAVAGDAAGSVFVLAEADDTISALDAELSRIVHTFHLMIPEGHALEAAWEADANSNGEGLLLLANGHVLVVKEKNPVALIEFAPEGTLSQGYRAEFAIGDRVFDVPAGSSTNLRAVGHWLLEPTDAERLPDVSEVAVDASGRVLLLSDQGRLLARIEGGLSPDQDTMRLEVIFTLPNDVAKPEGLVLASGAPLVAIDQKGKGAALFALDRLP